MLVLDTTFCIDHLRGRAEAKSKTDELDASGERLALVSASIVEFLVMPSAQGGERLREALDLVSRCEMLEVDEEIGMSAARLGGECLKRGSTVGAMNLVIAATAIRHRCAVLTRDPDFSRIPGVMVVSY
ncbi:MAG: type II toxin-antitoxin system VapC family toxin [Euryarchaeota archaeon]|nr:type II toxin-antitoxin system VapC family toxin [Euryarchaeota archaeon]MDE2045653.1 type II toxin-antitoxin system VapC family toxin [Thermoplasmata archaeon]